MGECKLNLGSGEITLPGHENLDIRYGCPAYPLDRPDCSADEIRASHLLEHFSHREAVAVVADWVRVLQPGGVLKLAVPDFDRIIDGYRNGSDDPTEAYLMGAHANEHDQHRAIYNAQKLTDLMRHVGLVDIRRWTSEIQDCAALPISLNLQGRKPNGAEVIAPTTKPVEEWQVIAAMSVPRLAFMDNAFCLVHLARLNIQVYKFTGAFWDQCLQRGLEEILAHHPGVDAILTVDYDTVFSRADVQTLIGLMQAHPEADAISALQSNRMGDYPLMTIKDAQGNTLPRVPAETFDGDITQAWTANFGLTLIRASRLRDFPFPWFCSKPDEEGRWGDGRTDADIWFWKQWNESGRTLYLANRVPVGHAELMIRWPGRDLKVIYQHPSEFWEKGRPMEVWR